MSDNIEAVKPLYCSFCCKSQHEVRKLIAGQTACICDECIDLCAEIVAEERAFDRLTKHGKRIISERDAERLDWMKTWTIGKPHA